MNTPCGADVLLAVFASPYPAEASIAEMRDTGHHAETIGALCVEGEHGALFEKLSIGDWTLPVAMGHLEPIGPMLAVGFFTGALGGPAPGVIDALAPLNIADEARYFVQALAAGETLLAVRGDDLARAAHIIARRRATLGRLYRGASGGVRGRTIISGLQRRPRSPVAAADH